MNGLRRKLAFSYGLLIVIIFGVNAWSVRPLCSLASIDTFTLLIGGQASRVQRLMIDP